MSLIKSVVSKKKKWINFTIQKVKLPNKKLSLMFKCNSSRNSRDATTKVSKWLYNDASKSQRNKWQRMINKSISRRNKKTEFKVGSILILLGLKFYGKKCVLLRISKRGFLIISGPFAFNGISLRRINRKFASPTAITIDISRLNTSFLGDKYFDFLKKSDKSNSIFDKQKLISFHRIRQATIDQYLKGEIKKNFFLKFYMSVNSFLLKH